MRGRHRRENRGGWVGGGSPSLCPTVWDLGAGWSAQARCTKLSVGRRELGGGRSAPPEVRPDEDFVSASDASEQLIHAISARNAFHSCAHLLCPDPQWPLDLTLGCDGALTNMRHADDDSVAQQRAQRQMRSAGAAVLPGDGRGPRPRLGAATRGNTRARSGLGRLRVPSGSRFEPKRRWDGGGSCTGSGCSGRQCRANDDCR